MNLSFLYPTSRFSTDLVGFSKKMKIIETITDSYDYDDIIVIANGTPDNRIFCILAHMLNGDKTLGVFKAKERTRMDFLDIISEYIGPNIENVLVIMDQEDQSLDAIFSVIYTKLREKGGGKIIDHGEKIKVVNCQSGPRNYKIMCVINGLNEINSNKHCIEDHLLKAAKIECDENSKNTWNRLNKDEQEEIYRRLLILGRTKLEEYFPQQLAALNLLKELNRAQ